MYVYLHTYIYIYIYYTWYIICSDSKSYIIFSDLEVSSATQLIVSLKQKQLKPVCESLQSQLGDLKSLWRLWIMIGFTINHSQHGTFVDRYIDRGSSMIEDMQSFCDNWAHNRFETHLAMRCGKQSQIGLKMFTVHAPCFSQTLVHGKIIHKWKGFSIGTGEVT